MSPPTRLLSEKNLQGHQWLTLTFGVSDSGLWKVNLFQRGLQRVAQDNTYRETRASLKSEIDLGTLANLPPVIHGLHAVTMQRTFGDYGYLPRIDWPATQPFPGKLK